MEQVLLGHRVGEADAERTDNGSLGGDAQLHQKDARRHAATVAELVGADAADGGQTGNAWEMIGNGGD